MKTSQELKELKSKDAKDLFKDLEESYKKLTQMKFEAAFKKIKNYKAIGRERKKIARIWTILGQKTLENINKENEKNATEK
jgi:ribosomal protein L29